MQLGAGDGGRHGKTIITNDGATILKSVWLDNPAAKILADVALQQDTVCGDGTTGVVVLAAELLKQAEILVNQNIHPQIITQGYRRALTAARERLEHISFGCEKERLREYLINVAKTTLSSKLLTHDKDHFAKIAVDAILRLKENASSLDLVNIIRKPGGCLRDSFLDEGFILEKHIGKTVDKFFWVNAYDYVQSKLGYCKKVEEILIGEDKVIRFSGCRRECPSETTPCARVYVSSESIMRLFHVIESLQSLAVEAFAKALRQIPTIILENGGLDSAEIVSQLRVLHLRGESSMGIDVEAGCIADMRAKGVLEAYKSKLSQICFAAEAAEMIVRVDDIIRCAPRERSGM
ncbi:UNVERIFIED_CONTAM: hypothetical protein H355_012708 [Colinus virginianus]|nr:hypothetical protein H355_012708 [Colinus virginianus]